MTTKAKAAPKSATEVITSLFDKLRDDNEINEFAAREEGIPYYGLDGLILYLKHAGNATRSYALGFKKRAEGFQRKSAGLAKDSAEYTALSVRVMAEVLAEGVITKIETSDGKVLPFGKVEKEQFVELMCSIPHKQDELVMFAANIANFRKSVLEAQAKNSVKS